MPLEPLETIRNLTEKGESFANWVADTYHSKNRVRKLLLLDAAVFVIFNPLTFPPLYQVVFPGKELWPNYGKLFWLIVVVIFAAALVEALRASGKKIPVHDPGERSAVKGLRAFGFADAEIFARLQRGAVLTACLDALTSSEFRLGVLIAESGCGKTSFLQAGVYPALSGRNDFPRPVYVKLSNEDPLLSIREAFRQHADLPREEVKTLDFEGLLSAAVEKHRNGVVLLLDQFEQFYVHHPRPEQQEPFVQALAQWYQNGKRLPVKVLFSVREDFYGKMASLQQTLGYSLAAQDIIRLGKFTPAQASMIFQVIAESAELSFDEKFVEELTLQELADRKDGLISPVDIQILAWVINSRGECLPLGKDRAEPGEQAGFTRTVYRKLGGIEGLLERFLESSLEALPTVSQRENALKVMLSLVDLEENARAGVLSVEAIQQKLAGAAGPEDIAAALNWLCGSGVRLVTAVERGGGQGYELTHERLINPLRNIEKKQLPDYKKVDSMLETRVNEWMGNDYHPRYLFNRKELRQIKQQAAFVEWGKWESQKKELIRQSRRRQLRRGAGALLAAIFLPLLLWQGYQNFAEEKEYADVRSAVTKVLGERNYYDQELSDKREGFPNSFVSHLDSHAVGDPTMLPADSLVVYDVASCLYWPRSASEKAMNYTAAKEYIAQLNQSAFGGYDDWRLPTWAEAMSLMQKDTTESGLHLDRLFTAAPPRIWTGDQATSRRIWRVDFRQGQMDGVDGDSAYHVWAVRHREGWEPFRGAEFAVKEMLQRNNYYDRGWNPTGKGINRQTDPYELSADSLVVYDSKTNLSWERSGSKYSMRYRYARVYIDSLNAVKFAGYSDWRLPTLEEAMSLMARNENSVGLYIDPIFDSRQRWIWTADQRSASVAWVVYFYYGHCSYDGAVRDRSNYVRAVRFGH